MQNHEPFEELCSLAAVGELSPNDQQSLSAHLTDCPACRNTLRDVVAITDSWLPASLPPNQEFAAVGLRSTRKLRERFLAHARERGIRLTQQSENPSSHWRRWPLRVVQPYLVAAAIIGCAAGAAVLIAAEIRNLRFTTEARLLRSQIIDLDRENASLREGATRDKQLRASQEAQAAARTREIDALRQERDANHTRVTALENNIAALTKSLDNQQGQLANTHAELAKVSQDCATANRNLTEVRAELDSAHATHAQDRLLLTAEEKRIDELSQAPRGEDATLERERQLLVADRDIRELMGARNLHIIDVHDRDSKGKPRSSFGRVFYTEGKSLIFYAFDLSDNKMRDASFQAWGHKEDGSREAINLGLFYMDDKQQSRWVLRFSDPAVLAEIDSVFVTVEPPGGRKKPSGEKLLYAFLNIDANHP
jgi:hypothetical protein